jgi:hypothetical protein
MKRWYEQAEVEIEDTPGDISEFPEPSKILFARVIPSSEQYPSPRRLPVGTILKIEREAYPRYSPGYIGDPSKIIYKVLDKAFVGGWWYIPAKDIEFLPEQIQEAIEEDDLPVEDILVDLVPYPYNKFEMPKTINIKSILTTIIELLRRNPLDSFIAVFKIHADTALSLYVMDIRQASSTGREADTILNILKTANIIKRRPKPHYVIADEYYTYVSNSRSLQEAIEEDDEPASRLSQHLAPYPLNKVTSRTPNSKLLKDILLVLRDPDWFLEIRPQYEPLSRAVSLVNVATGEIRSLPRDSCRQAADTLMNLDILEFADLWSNSSSKMYQLKKLQESITEEDDEGNIDAFTRPTQLDIIEQITSASTYFDAWKLFDTHYQHIYELNELNATEDDDSAIIPTGYGSFEAWWLGIHRAEKNEWPSPEKNITVEDIHMFAENDPSELFGLFVNVFYNKTLPNFNTEVLEELCKLLMASEDSLQVTRELLGYSRDVLENLLSSPAFDQLSAKVRKQFTDMHRGSQQEAENIDIQKRIQDPVQRDLIIAQAIKKLAPLRR